ncbi:putative ribonuclease p complex subunit protein [Eutypa lata UCREL1]|uniref:Putative ribonuclease p complex subunit protein n=1 Tax=Eutypa lata (strain UCR-EL1) TaxID=1287681 RepID=M7T528_EUTLA|nr:putative ribonuclease p complex subunit protein [Eutypa lata UCREL1]
MCFVFTCGEHTFRKEVEGYEGVICQCHNCGNYSGRVIKSNPWFTFCFVPVLPLSFKGYHDVVCHICNFAQPLENRPDVLNMKNGGGGGNNNIPMQNQGGPPQGWGQHGGGGGGGAPPPQGPPPPGQQEPMRYA